MPTEHIVPRSLSWLGRLRIGIYGLLFVAVCALILVLNVPLGDRVDLEVGDVSQTDVRAPRRMNYVSALLTDRERERAAQSVPDVYDPPDARIRRQQMTRADDVLHYFDAVRHDSYASTVERATYLGAVADLSLNPGTVDKILSLSDPSWTRVTTEVPQVLDRLMRDEIRQNRLLDKYRLIPGLVSLDLSEAEADVSAALVQGLLQPNSLFATEKTAQARQRATESVQPVSVSIEKGETILRAGDLVKPEDLEILEALDLRQSQWSWPLVLRSLGFMIVMGFALGLYLARTMPEFWQRRRQTPLLLALLITFVLAAKFMVPGHAIQPYLFPVAALTMMISVLLDTRLSVLVTLFMAIVMGLLTGGSVELIVYVAAGGLVGALVLGRGERLSLLMWAGLAVSATNLAVIAVFRLPERLLDWTGLAQLGVAAVINGTLASSVTLLGFYVLGSFLGVTTMLQLAELGRPTHPLLRELVLKAPGTYHHTIIVSNLAEQAAQAIGADAYLTRVGAYYHDIGKMIRPYFFIENRVSNVNPHDHLDPHTSAAIILSHVKDGLDLARKHRLPPRIQDFIREHHGTTLVSYFYKVACDAAPIERPVHEGDFRYPGPRPQSRETAILMLADVCEATVRATRPQTVDELTAMVHKMIERRVMEGELSACDLTLRDLDLVAEAFVCVLQGINHPRIDYPEPAAVGTVASARPAPATVESPPVAALQPAGEIKR